MHLDRAATRISTYSVLAGRRWPPARQSQCRSIACRASRMRLFASADSVPSLRHRRHAMPPQTQCHSTTWLHVVSRIASLRQCAQHCRRPIASPAAATPCQPAPGRARAAAALEPPSSGKAPELAPLRTARRRNKIDILGLRRRIPSHKWRSGQCMNEWLQLLTTVRTDLSLIHISEPTRHA